MKLQLVEIVFVAPRTQSKRRKTKFEQNQSNSQIIFQKMINFA